MITLPDSSFIVKIVGKTGSMCVSEETLCEEPEINGNDKMHLMSSTIKMLLTIYFGRLFSAKHF